MSFQQSSSGEMEGDVRNWIDKLSDPIFKFLWSHCFFSLIIILLLFFLCFSFSWTLFRLFLFLRLCFTFSCTLSLGLPFNNCLLLSFLSRPILRDDSLSFGINFEHVLLFIHSLSDLIDGSIDYINKAFQRIFVERVDLRKIWEQEEDQGSSRSSRSIKLWSFVNLSLSYLGNLDFFADFNSNLFGVL